MNWIRVLELNALPAPFRQGLFEKSENGFSMAVTSASFNQLLRRLLTSSLPDG